MASVIPCPRIGRRQSNANPAIVTLQDGPFVQAIQTIWGKLNYNNGVNLHPFRHNMRPYLDEGEPSTNYEIQTIRALLSDPELQIVVSPAGNGFKWDNRMNAYERKCIFIDEALFFIIQFPQNESQFAAIRIILLATVLHCLGDYITVWSQPAVNFATNTNVHRVEGGTKTEFVFFGGRLGGFQSDGVHYDCAIIRTFNAMNQTFHWFIPDSVARDVYNADVIAKFNEVNLTPNQNPPAPSNTIRQIDICCGWHRTVWIPIRRAPQPPPPPSNWQPYPPQPGPQGPNYPPPNWGYNQYGPAPGISGQPPSQFPPPPAGGNYGPYTSAPPPANAGTYTLNCMLLI
jgi:hypothetical protein